MVISEELTQRIRISRYRKGVLEKLAQGIKSPRELEIQLNIRLNHISRTLAQLIELKLVKCLTPKLGRNRLFTITKKGKSVVRKIRGGRVRKLLKE